MPAGRAGTERVFADGGFATPSGRGRFVAVGSRRPAAAPSREWPFVLNSGRVRDQWHTMTRTGLSPRLSVHVAEPFVEMHPVDARAHDLDQGALARVETAFGTAILRVLVSEGQQRGSLFAPIHWSAENSSGGRIGALVQPTVDPFSGQPDAKATPARILPVMVSHYGFALSRSPIATDGMTYWARSRMPEGHVTFLALDRPAEGWAEWSRTRLPGHDRLVFEDLRSGLFRSAALENGRLKSVLYVSPGPTLPGLEWLKSQFARAAIPAAERRSLLAGRALAGEADGGAIVCVCFQVGRKRIERAIRAGATSCEAIGSELRAGTNCGSCVPELRRLIAAAKLPSPAE
jgi:assimilatory nitrate reductase catalytic subunit